MNIANATKIVRLGRPQYLAGDFLLFTMGALLALLSGAQFVLGKFVLGYSILFFAHLSVHYSNDYYDFEVDKLNRPTPISGGSGVLVNNPELKEFSKWFSIVLMSLSLVLTAIFMVTFKYPITFFLFLLFGNLLAWFYTAPPLKLVYRRLGEISNVVAVVIFLGTGYFALMGTLDLLFFIFCIPLIFLQLIFISSFEIPDMEGDSLGGKRTWIVLYGRSLGFRIIALSGFMATASFFLILFAGLFPKIDFRVLTSISLIALGLGVVELVKKPFNRESATKFSMINVAILFLMSILIDAYFVYLIK
jgi:1,4-dihydroxy-2-naphthoate polyprenyltransferase